MSITSGFIKSKKYRTLSDLTHQLQSLWTAADTVEYTDDDLSGTSLSETRPVSIMDETDFEALTSAVKDNGYIYYVYATDSETGNVTSYIYTKGVTYGVGDPSVELTTAEYEALPSTKETDDITYYLTDGVPSGSITTADLITYDNSDSTLSAATVNDAIDELDSEKQDALTAGTNITISNNVISATNTTYSTMSASELTTGTATTARSVRADYLNTGITTMIENFWDSKVTVTSTDPGEGSTLTTGNIVIVTE